MMKLVVYSHDLSQDVCPLPTDVNAAALHQIIFSLTDTISD